MCGIAGFWDPSHQIAGSEVSPTLARMLRAIQHRGPDDSGEYFDSTAGLALGHRRLSIVDLSPLGHQPMTSASGRFVTVYNGEVYNHAELRKELERLGTTFRGHSDTEVMLAAFEQWGIEEALRKFNGMFALAIWDRERRTLVLVRDRLGIKPLYIGKVGRALVFASELTPLRTVPGFEGSINRDSLTLFMRHNYVPDPHSIFTDVARLMPGCTLEVSEEVLLGSASLGDWRKNEKAYWSAREIVEQGVAAPLDGDDATIVDDLHKALLKSVGYRMIADVPLGAFLSGGVDSSTVVALMQAQASRPVKTFSIGFREDGYDEATYARQVAEHLGTDHTELYVSPQEAMSVIPRLPRMFDEPFADSSQIPTFLVSELARRHVTVGLSGDGGDELFGGYNRYTWGHRLWGKFGRVPGLVRRAAGSTLAASPGFWGGALSLAMRVLPDSWSVSDPRQKVEKLAAVLHHRSIGELYLDLVSHWNAPEEIVIGGREPLTVVSDSTRRARVSNEIEQMMATDLVSYLPGDILTKVDRASMAVSLEARVPLLDYNVVELAWKIPFHMKVRNGEGKWVLKQVLRKYVPETMIDRPKMGFGVPIDSWLRVEMRDWADDLLSQSTLQRQGYFDPEPIVRMWKQHRSGEVNNHYLLWDVLMFQSWLAELDRPLESENQAGHALRSNVG